MKKAVLVRVGIDQRSIEKSKLKQVKMLGEDRSKYFKGWNAPVNPESWEFAYVPIPEEGPKEFYSGCDKTTYEDFKKPCEKLGVDLPSEFDNIYAHLDPDFRYLTYGDIDEEDGKNHRGRPLRDLQEDDLLVFYAALDPGRWKDNKLELVYAIIGLFVIKEKPRRATEIPEPIIDKYRCRNAHTRLDYKRTDIIVCAKPAPLSGRLTKCIPIGKRRGKGKQYRVTEHLLGKWGGLWVKNRWGNMSEVEDGWIQRSPRLPYIGNPAAFSDWFQEKLYTEKIQLVQQNNLD